MLATNDIPHMEAADDALFRRVVIVPFDRVFAKSEQDPSLFDKLKEEAPGILAWIVKGAVEWLRSGLQVPEPLVAIRDSIRRDMDPLAQFLEDTCLPGGTFETTSAALHAAFALWGQRHCIPHMDGRSFGKALSKRGYRSRKSNGRMVIQGLRLRPEFQTLIHLAGDAA
jgi:putative DNA primase/helicase